MIVKEVHDPLEELVALLTHLPGVGERTARRLALHLMRAPTDYPEKLARALLELRGTLRECRLCGNLSDSETCPICADDRRESSSLCVVSSVQDLMTIERSGSYRGRYFVLYGYIAPLEGRGPDDLDVEKLLSLIDSEGVEEVILATNPTVEGEATAGYLADRLRPKGVRISRISSGIQHGGEIEYADPVSVASAMDKRRDY
jgi:recombination protein RecR